MLAKLLVLIPWLVISRFMYTLARMSCSSANAISSKLYNSPVHPSSRTVKPCQSHVEITRLFQTACIISQSTYEAFSSLEGLVRLCTLISRRRCLFAPNSVCGRSSRNDEDHDHSKSNNERNANGGGQIGRATFKAISRLRYVKANRLKPS